MTFRFSEAWLPNGIQTLTAAELLLVVSSAPFAPSAISAADLSGTEVGPRVSCTGAPHREESGWQLGLDDIGDSTLTDVAASYYLVIDGATDADRLIVGGDDQAIPAGLWEPSFDDGAIFLPFEQRTADRVRFDQLEDVDATGDHEPTDGQAPLWSADQERWVPGNVSTSPGGGSLSAGVNDIDPVDAGGTVWAYLLPDPSTKTLQRLVAPGGGGLPVIVVPDTAGSYDWTLELPAHGWTDAPFLADGGGIADQTVIGDASAPENGLLLRVFGDGSTWTMWAFPPPTVPETPVLPDAVRHIHIEDDDFTLTKTDGLLDYNSVEIDVTDTPHTFVLPGSNDDIKGQEVTIRVGVSGGGSRPDITFSVDGGGTIGHGRDLGDEATWRLRQTGAWRMVTQGGGRWYWVGMWPDAGQRLGFPEFDTDGWTVEIVTADYHEIDVDQDGELHVTSFASEPGAQCRVVLVQDGTGGWDVTLEPTLIWPDGAPTLNTDPGAKAVIHLEQAGTDGANETIARLIYQTP